MSEFPVEPNTLSWLAQQPGAHVVGASELSPQEIEEGEDRAELIVDAWAKTPAQRAFLVALSQGHEISEARRISGLTRSRADALIRRMRD